MVEQEPQSAGPGVTRYEAARLLGLSVKRVDQLRGQGHLVAQRDSLTGKVAIDLESLHRLIVARDGKVGPVRRWVFRRSQEAQA
jgi:hypothetical protein